MAVDPSLSSVPLSPEPSPNQETVDPERTLLLFQQQSELGLPLEDIQEILNPSQIPITPIPNTLAGVRGMLNLRGQVMLVLDLGYLLRYRYNSGLHPNQIIVTRAQSRGFSDSRPPNQLGLLVERVHYVASTPLPQIRTPADLASVPPSYRARLSPLAIGTADWEDRSWQLLSVTALLNSSHWL